MASRNSNGHDLLAEEFSSKEKGKCLIEPPSDELRSVGDQTSTGDQFFRVSRTRNYEYISSVLEVFSAGVVNMCWFRAFECLKKEMGIVLRIVALRPEFEAVVDAMYLSMETGTPGNLDVEYVDGDWVSSVPVEVFLDVSISILEDNFLSHLARIQVESFLSAIMEEIYIICKIKFGVEFLTPSAQAGLEFFKHGPVLAQFKEWAAVANLHRPLNPVVDPFPACKLGEDQLVILNLSMKAGFHKEAHFEHAASLLVPYARMEISLRKLKSAISISARMAFADL